MFRSRKRAVGIAVMAILALVLAACSSTGGKRAAEAAAAAPERAVAAGHANTPHYTIAMITHAAPGDTFWDIIRAGATAAAAKDNITLKYSSNPDPTQQAQLITDAINSHVNGIAVTDPDPGGHVPDGPEGQGGRDPRGHVQRGRHQLAAVRRDGVLRPGRSHRGRRGGQAARGGGRQERALRPAGPGPGSARGPVRGREAGPRLRGHDEQALRERRGQLGHAVLDDGRAHQEQEHRRGHHPRRAGRARRHPGASQQAHSTTKLYTFDTNAAEIAKIKSGAVQWAVDQQPYLQGYVSVDSLWLYLTNGDTSAAARPC